MASSHLVGRALRLVRRLTGFGLAAAALLGAGPSQAGWRPEPGQRFDIQLTARFDLVRDTDVLALELFATSAARVQQLHSQKAAAVCYIAAGFWENWRPDAGQFPQPAVGRSRIGWPGQRWLDVRHPALRPILERRLDLCRDRGFDGVLLAGLDGYAQATGFAFAPNEQLAFNRWLAEAAHQRGLAVGIVNDLDQAAELATSFDFLIADSCVAQGDCTHARPFLQAGKQVYLLAYTNVARRMDEHCALAAAIGAPLIIKTQSLNGKLHRHCP